MNVWTSLKYGMALSLILGLLFSSGLFSVLVYGKISGKDWTILSRWDSSNAGVSDAPPDQAQATAPSLNPIPGPAQVRKDSVSLSVPAIRQYPELPRGCEITSLTMLLQFYGLKANKMDYVNDMVIDPTPIVRDDNGAIVSWGDPNTGFVGEISGKGNGYGIYHTALFQTLQKHVPTAADLTGSAFDKLEAHLSGGVPIVVWTTIDFQQPAKWVVWNSPSGPVQATFSEHSVLLVGYDDKFVYVNDPNSGKANVQIDKAQFIATWEALGKQAISYDKFK